MRTKTIIKKGHFWLRGKESEKVSGEVTIEDGGSISLNLFGIFHEGLDVDKYFDVLGFLENNHGITLKNCHYVRRTLFNKGVPTASINSERAILGVHFLKEQDPLFDEISFSTDCLIEWLGLSAIKVNRDHSIVTVSTFEPIEHKLENGDVITIHFGTEGPSQPVSSVLEITQTAYIRYSSQTLLTINELYSRAYSIRDFITLGVDHSVFLSNVILHSPQTQDCFLYKGYRVFQKDGNFKVTPSKIRQDSMLFGYQFIKESFSKIINNWLKIYGENIDVMELYFSVQSGKALDEEMEFLHYVQGLESLHRNKYQLGSFMPEKEYEELLEKIFKACPSTYHDWINSKLEFANVPPFSKRVKELINRYPNHFGNSKQRKYMSENIFKCRNLLTHLGGNGVKQCLKGQSMTDLRKTTRLLFQFLFMELIGISENEMNIIVKKNKCCQSVLENSLPSIKPT